MDEDIEKLLALTKEAEAKKEKPKKEIKQSSEEEKKVVEEKIAKPAKKEEKPKKEIKKPSEEVLVQEPEVSDITVKASDKDVFVKIDDHVEIAQILIDSKKELKDISDTIFLLAKAEKLKKEAIEKMSKQLNELKAKTNKVYDKMAKYGKYVGYEIENRIVKKTMSEIGDLTKELNDIRKELAKL